MRDRDTLDEAAMLSDGKSVLRVFQEYLMTPGKMLCFYGQNLERYHDALAELSAQGLLKAEDFAGGYSLTIKGYAAMQRL